MSAHRPSRHSSATKKYVNDPFEGIRNQLYASSDSGSSTSEASEPVSEAGVVDNEDEDEDDDLKEFDKLVDEVDEAEVEDEPGLVIGDVPDNDNESIIEVDYSDGKFDPGSHGDGRAAERRAMRNALRQRGTWQKPRRVKVHSMGIAKGQMHARGVEEWGRGAREIRAKFLFGPSIEDLKPVLRTKDLWKDQQTLPLKGYSLRKSYYCEPEALEKEIKKTREWYWGTGRDALERGQMSRVLSRSEGEVYMANSGTREINVLLGPYVNQKLYSMKRGEFMSMATPFENKKNRNGWISNLGSKVLETQWVPNEEGRIQYLSVVVEQKRTTGRPPQPMQNPQAPAFTAQKGYPASIQVWAFNSLENGDLDPDTPPKLELVICTDWGSLKQLRWNPVPVADTVEPVEGGNKIHIGLLAGVWVDGKAKILDISYPKPHPTFPRTHYLYFSKAAFEVEPPNTICACLTWLSGTSLAVGTAQGTVGIWTLTRPETFPRIRTQLSDPPTVPSQYNPRPWFYKLLSATYILTITSGFPSKPHLISITSADGFDRLIDLRSPTLDTVATTRSRIFGSTQSWHDQTQSFLTPDDSNLMRNHTIRRYYMNLHSMRVEHQIVCSATSPVHPCVLLGCSDGVVTAGNPVARVLNCKEVPWQQIWFCHEWRKGLDQIMMDNMEIDGQEQDEEDQGDAASVQENIPKVPPEVLKEPLSRITEGYKPTTVSLQKADPKEIGRDGKYITIFEEPTTITCLAWNPNLQFGTWAVAGMGDGLLRVEDLAVGTEQKNESSKRKVKWTPVPKPVPLPKIVD
ncbi:hypothetical protein K469DRAFT_720466 [Zopfia rhizophila CBS 207.26]|uniref:WD40 repeat-like protein n=1 Tax=Zopfia rhizophila CBS 207.26 TaxID=1314779 RepID=A0A6A6EK95_9PEZI|nr:hypothetical protein K469DRAFT_720466 [Zopfia rhizophila CBS 207.26]